MTSFALSLGSALVAFSPTLSLLLLFAYKKAQLVIIVTTASFFHLLACLLAALIHLPFKSLGLGVQNIFIIVPTSVIAQAIARCVFVYGYHKVESVIEKSIQKHEEQNNSSESDQGGVSETDQLKLELNDTASGIAAGVGYAFFHTVMLYGTLLASENSRMGTLYQDSCTFMPSIFNSALMAFMFGILDIVWMLFTFYGMRRYKEFKERNGVGRRGSSSSRNEPVNGRGSTDFDWSFQINQLGGKMALAIMVATHFAAAFATLPNQTFALNGCVVALPSLAFVTIVTCFIFWFYCKKNYLPQGQQQRIRLASRHVD